MTTPWDLKRPKCAHSHSVERTHQVWRQLVGQRIPKSTLIITTQPRFAANDELVMCLLAVSLTALTCTQAVVRTRGVEDGYL